MATYLSKPFKISITFDLVTLLPSIYPKKIVRRWRNMHATELSIMVNNQTSEYTMEQSIL